MLSPAQTRTIFPLLRLRLVTGRLLRCVAQKLGERHHQFFRIVFGDLSARLDAGAAKVVGPRFPQRQRVVKEHLNVAAP